MNSKAIALLKKSRKLYHDIFKPEKKHFKTYSDVVASPEQANDLIYSILSSNEPTMICRLGSVELNCVFKYQNQKKKLSKYIEYIRGDINAFWWDITVKKEMATNAGFFPINPSNLEKFSEMMIRDMAEVDILGSWLKQEQLFKHELKDVYKVRLPDLEPYYHKNPWSRVLRGKKVLVVHPYAETIQEQYNKRYWLFNDKSVLPEFELKTIKGVQSIANNKTKFRTWFDALDHMKKQIENSDFDICILGCGAYGFPLAAHVKRLGKQAVHLGGPVQILFGIKGKRWENHWFISKLFNKHWVDPSISEIPKDFKNVEDGCYW